ncbi:DUF2760 domain-containing protein [Malikia granosa]|uniref:DUF2760 domain-containing protein n=1 Tax=Malikia granosa TaxID=263067 RepID=A0A2S9K9Q7_9BURK|nr:DUF2760 domain-containing protein [Malikia granosa]PRD67168.1 DUF2760 domain-containing protein [Malikia granosa]
MSTHSPNLLSRLSLALASFFSILSRPGFAADVERLRREGWPAPVAPVAAAPAAPVAPVALVAPVAPVTPPPAPAPQLAPETAALQLLGLLQREARFIDFVQEEVQAYGDAEIGAAARVVHEGCRKVLREHFTLEPVRAEAEGSRLTLQPGFDAAAVRVTGNVVGQPPFTGTLGHRGWRASETRLPKLGQGHDASVLAQAEVEL